MTTFEGKHMRISDANIKLWSSSEKSNSRTQYSKQVTTSIEETDPQARVIGSLQELNLTYNARYLAKKQLQSSSTSEITSADKNSLTKISNDQAITEIVSSVLSKEINLFNSQFSFNNDLMLSSTNNNEQLLIDTNNNLAFTDNKITTNTTLSGQLSMQFEAYELVQETEEMQVRAMGEVVLEDGRSIDFALELNMQRSFELEQNLKSSLNTRILKDPLVINLTGAPVELTESSFQFDIDSDGQQDEISFVRPGSGLLVLDINEDGVINNGSELFGANTGQGFAELAQYDSDANLWIDENDPIFEKLQVWTKDEQGNDSLVSLNDAGVGAIYLGSTASEFDLTDDQNQLLGKVQRSGVFLKENGEVSSIQQIDLAKHDTSTTDKQLENTFSQLSEQFDGNATVQNSNNELPLAPAEASDNILLAESALELATNNDNDAVLPLEVATNNDSVAILPIKEKIEKVQEIIARQEVKSQTETVVIKKTLEEEKPTITQPKKEKLSYASKDAIDRLNQLSESLDNYKQEQQIKHDRLNSLLDSLKENRKTLEEYRHTKSNIYQGMRKPTNDE